MGDGLSLKLKKLYKDTYDFVGEKWVVTHDEQQASRLQKFAFFWLLVFKSFSRNKGPIRATALAYTTLLGLIPLLAVGFGITSTFLRGQGKEATRELIEHFVDAVAPQLQLLSKDTKDTNNAAASPSPESTNYAVGPAERSGATIEKKESTMPAQTGSSTNAAAVSGTGALNPAKAATPRDEVVGYINQFIQNAQSKTLGLTGVLGFIVVAIMLLSTIEGTFNDIWGVTRGRSWFRRFVQYWAAISLGPVALALIVTLVSGGFFQSGRDTLQAVPWVSRWVAPFLIVSACFAIFYKVMPNTQVHWRSAGIAGIVGGTLWLFMNIFASLQLSKVVSMSAIYGSVFALIPIFLIGLYFSWLILLFGAQVAYALQNRKMYLQERKAESVNQRGREYVALRMMIFVAQAFEHGASPPTLLELGTILGVPSRLISRVLKPLVEAGLLHEVLRGDETGYTPGRPLDTITCHDILFCMRVGGGQELVTRDEPTRSHVSFEFERICEVEREAASISTLRDLVKRIPYIAEHHNCEQVERMWKEETISS